MRKSLLIAFIIVLTVLPYGLSQGSVAQSSYNKANKLFVQQRYADALALYQSILTSRSDDIAPGLLYVRIADSHFKLNNYTKALETYRRALKEQSLDEQPQTQYWIGFCCLMLGKDAEAAAEFLKIPENYPFAGMWVGTAYYWAGRSCERMGKKDEAALYFRKAAGSGKSTQERFALKKANAVKSK